MVRKVNSIRKIKKKAKKKEKKIKINKVEKKGNISRKKRTKNEIIISLILAISLIR